MKFRQAIPKSKLLYQSILTIVLVGCLTPCYASYLSQHIDQTNSDSLTKSRRYFGRIDILPQIGGPELLGVEVNAFLSRKISANAGAGILGGFHLGSNYYLYNKSKRAPVAPYAGLQFFVFSLRPDARYPGWYMPLGLEYASNGIFTLQFEVGIYRMYLESNDDTDALNILVPVLAALRLGMNINKTR